MPQSQMLTSLKNVSESMIGLLTLLLQVLVHQLECQPPIEDNEEPPNAEVTQTMNNMFQELQNQKQVVQSLVANQMSRTVERSMEHQLVPSTAAPSQPATTPSRTWAGVSSAPHPALSTTMVNRVLQDLHLPAPGSPSPSTWILAEEEEEYEELAVPEISRTRVRPNNARVSPQPQSAQVSLADWGNAQITWGRKRKGKTYQEVFRTEPLVIGEVPEFATQSTGLRAVLPSSSGTGSTELSGLERSCVSSFPQKAVDSSLSQEVQCVREQLSNSTLPKKSNDEISQACDVAEGLIEQVFLSAKSSYPKSRITLLEVYAGPQSPLVEAVRSLGFKAIRFTKDDGDLSTLSGRRKLWETIDRCQPENIWVAPECRPWGGWARLNQFKSVKLFDQISQDQQEQRQHVKLCASLWDFQRSRGRHFHLEQPLGSRMPELSEFQDIRDHTQVVHVDMCAFGLKIPGTQKYLRKGSLIFSSCPSLISDLHGSRCPKTHEHQNIEGSVNVQGQRMRLTQFCASYCKGFARHVAKSLCQHIASALVNEHEDSPPLKKVRISHNSQKRFRPNLETSEDLATGSTDKPDDHMTELPEAEDPNPASGFSQLEPVAVNPEPSPSTDRWREAFRLADLAAPRVGNVKIPPESTLLGIVQSLVPEIQITEVFVCRGTERFQLPISLSDPAQAPIRHTVCLHRNHNTIHDLGSENWFELRRLQRTRHSIPSKLYASLPLVTCLFLTSHHSNKCSLRQVFRHRISNR